MRAILALALFGLIAAASAKGKQTIVLPILGDSLSDQGATGAGHLPRSEASSSHETLRRTPHKQAALRRCLCWRRMQAGDTRTSEARGPISAGGGVFALSGGRAPDPRWYYQGRFTNGPNWVDLVTERIGKKYDVKARCALLARGQPLAKACDALALCASTPRCRRPASPTAALADRIAAGCTAQRGPRTPGPRVTPHIRADVQPGCGRRHGLSLAPHRAAVRVRWAKPGAAQDATRPPGPCGPRGSALEFRGAPVAADAHRCSFRTRNRSAGTTYYCAPLHCRVTVDLAWQTSTLITAFNNGTLPAPSKGTWVRPGSMGLGS
jgi:hypothetical protein